MRVHWTNNAIENLAGIHGHIALNSPVYAQRMVDKITRRLVQIDVLVVIHGTQLLPDSV